MDLNLTYKLSGCQRPSLERAGIDTIRFHDLRHTYASLLLVNGAPMKYIQHWLRYSTIKMTMDLYTHLLPEVTEQCVNLLDCLVRLSQPVEVFCNSKSKLSIKQQN